MIPDSFRLGEGGSSATGGLIGPELLELYEQLMSSRPLFS